MTDRIIHVTYTPLHFFIWLTEANPLVWTAHLCTQRQGHLLNILSYFWGSFIPHRCWMRAHITNTSGGFLDWGVCDFVKSACQTPSPKWLYNQLLHAHAHTKRKPILLCKKLRCYIIEGKQKSTWYPELQRRWDLQLTSGVRTQNQELSCLMAKEASAKSLHRIGFE